MIMYGWSVCDNTNNMHDKVHLTFAIETIHKIAASTSHQTGCRLANGRWCLLQQRRVVNPYCGMDVLTVGWMLGVIRASLSNGSLLGSFFA